MANMGKKGNMKSHIIKKKKKTKGRWFKEGVPHNQNSIH